MRVRLTILLSAGALLLAACGDGTDAPAEPSGGETTSSGGRCESVSTPRAKQVSLDPPPAKPADGRLSVVFATNCGSFTVALDTKGSPRTAASFAYLAELGVFDATPFHRIALNPPIIQGGDPQGGGTGGPGYFVDEEVPIDAEYTRGVVAMAKTEAEPPGRSGSQFFIVTGADAGLPAQYAIAGEVSEGFGVVELISQYGDPTGQSEAPLEPVVIETATVEAG